MAGFRKTSGDGLTITGVKELDDLFKQLPDGVQKRALRPGLRDAAKVVQAEVIRTAPVDSGILKRSIKVRAGKRSRKGTVRVNVTTGDRSGNVFKGKAFYGAFVEFGHKTGKRGSKNRKEIAPKPFMRPAFDNKKQEAEKVAKDAIGKGIVKEALSLAAKLQTKKTK